MSIRTSIEYMIYNIIMYTFINYRLPMKKHSDQQSNEQCRQQYN